MTAPALSSPTPPRRATRPVVLVVTTLMVVAAAITWAFSTSPGTAAGRVGLFLVACACVLTAFRRRLGPALVIIGFMSLAHHQGPFEAIDVWAFVFAGCTAAGAALWLHKVGAVRWLAASLPFWTLANAHGFFMAGALVLSIAGLVIAAVGPTLPGRRKRRPGTPLAHLANGPLVQVTPSAYYGGQRSRVISWLTWLFLGLTLALSVVAGRGVAREETSGLAAASLIIATTFAISNWFATRIRLRIDEAGLHSRTLFREHTIPWREVSGLTLRYLFLPGYGMRLVYYVAYSPAREFAFTSGMKGAKELQTSIERAVGLEWPMPEIEANFP